MHESHLHFQCYASFIGDIDKNELDVLPHSIFGGYVKLIWTSSWSSISEHFERITKNLIKKKT